MTADDPLDCNVTDARREPLSTEQIIDLESGGQCAVNVARALADRLAAAEETNRIAALHLSEMEATLKASEKDCNHQTRQRAYEWERANKLEQRLAEVESKLKEYEDRDEHTRRSNTTA